MKRLTPKQQKFADAVLRGEEYSDAYRCSYDCPLSSPQTVGKEAGRTAALPHVAAYIRAERAKLARVSDISREEKLQRLAARTRHGKLIDRDGIKALEVHNLMTGDNAPQQVNVFGLSDLLNMVRAKSK